MLDSIGEVALLALILVGLIIVTGLVFNLVANNMRTHRAQLDIYGPPRAPWRRAKAGKS